MKLFFVDIGWISLCFGLELFRWINTRSDVLTIEELAVYLKIPKSTLYKLVFAKANSLPEVGRHLAFPKRGH